MVVDPLVTHSTKNVTGISFQCLYDVFPMMKWAQPLGTPRAVITNYNYVGNTTFALPLSKMMQCKLYENRLPEPEWLKALCRPAPVYFENPEDPETRHGKCCVCQRGRCLGRCPNPKCGLLMHLSCAPMTVDGSSFVCPVCKAHDGLIQLESLTAKEVEAEDTMEEFAQRSLAKIHPSIDCNHCFKCFCNRVTYSVHDIQLKFLKEYATSKGNLQKYHKLLTDRY